MTLKEKFEPYVIRYTQDDVVGYLPEEVPILEYQEQCEKIAEEFAIGFALWKETQVTQDDNGLYYGESRIAVSRKNPVDIYKLLEIYKKEKGL